MTSRLFCCMIFLCKGLHLPHNPLLRHFLQVPLKKTPTPFWSGRFFISQKAFWKNQVEGALKRKNRGNRNGIGMLYLEQMHETAQNRTNEREQARHTNHRHRTPNPDRRSHHASRTGTEEPTQADKHSLLVIDIYIIQSNK